MVKIEDIGLNIEKIIETNESIVSYYDPAMMCEDYESTIVTLKQLTNDKKDLIQRLEKSMNEFFEIKENFITKRFKIHSFKLLPNFINYKYKFNLPKAIDKTSRNYYCYISLMEHLKRRYDVITCEDNEYYILDITGRINLKELLKDNEDTFK